LIDVPSFGDALGGALRDTWPALRTWLASAIAIVVLCVGGLVIVALLNPPTDGTTTKTLWEAEAMGALVVAFLAASFFALASAVRTVRPEFRMTVGRFFGVLGYSLVASLAIVLGLICLIVPGLYLLVKIGLAPYFYLIGEPGRNPLATAWTRTRDRFWLTAAMIFVSGVILEVLAYAAGGIVAVAALLSPFAGALAIPVAFALFLVAMQFQYNVYMRWVSVLR